MPIDLDEAAKDAAAAINEYIEALTHAHGEEGAAGYKFKVEYGRVCIGTPAPKMPEGVIWAMSWDTPEELRKKAGVCRLGLPYTRDTKVRVVLPLDTEKD